MVLSREQLESKVKENSLTSEDLERIIQDQIDAEKYRKLKEKMQEIETDSYLLDRLDACDASGAVEVLREFLSDK